MKNKANRARDIDYIEHLELILSETKCATKSNRAGKTPHGQAAVAPG